MNLKDFCSLDEGETIDAVKRITGVSPSETISYGFVVEEGWIRFRQCGDNIYEDYHTNYWDDCDTAITALDRYESWASELRGEYRTERMTAGKCWSEKTAFAQASVYVYDGEGDCIAEATLDEARYGLEDYECEEGNC